MDNKPREVVKRGASRVSPAKRSPNKHSRRKLPSTLSGGGDVDVSERSKEEKVRGLSLISRACSTNEDSEMGDGSEGEKQLPLPPPPRPPTTGGRKRFKLHRKPLDDCNSVDHAAVPRKLRSAMIKRNCKSVSPPLVDAKKLHHTFNGMEPPHMNGAKKSRQNMKQGGGSNCSLRQTVSGPITKDEEEVVETLYSLARLFPNNMPVKSRVDLKTSEAKTSPLQETTESSMLASEAPKEETMKSHYASINAEATIISSTVGESSRETVKTNPLTESTVLERPTVFRDQKFDLGLDISTLQVEPERTSLLSNGEHADDMPLSDAAKLGVSSKLCPKTGLTQPSQSEAHVHEQKQHNGLWPVASITRKPEQQQPIKENKESGTSFACIEGASSLSLGMSKTGSCGGAVHGPSSLSSTKTPAWLDSATCATKPSSTSNDVSKEKVQPVIVDGRQSWKRCAAHVYISGLIQDCQTAEKKARWPVPPNQLKLNERTNLGVTATNDLTGLRNGLNGIISVGTTNGLNRVTSVYDTNDSSAGRNPNELRFGIIQDKRFLHDQQKASITSGMYASQNQSHDFLSLSTGGGGLESTTANDSNQGGKGLDSSAHLHVPRHQPIFQHHLLMPFSLPHSPYSSSPYPDQLKAATVQQVQLQLPQYLGKSPFYGPPHLGHAGSAKQQQQQQQQQMWAAQLMSQYRPGGISMSHFPKWQNGRPDSPSLVPCGQPILPPSPPSMEVLSAKFSPGPQQQQLFSVSSSMSSSRWL